MIIAFIFILVGIIFMIGTLIYTRKKNNLQEVKPIDKSNIKKGKKTLSNLWGIDGFNNQVITINKNQHSIIIELESIEYSLLHDGEKANVDRELISIAQMLKFPIQFLEVKKQIEIGDMLEEIKISTINANDNVKEYANQIIAHLEKLQEDQNLFERKNYMVISSFNNRKVAESELKEFYQLLRYHLLNIKVSTRLLNDREIVELIYEQLHKGNKNKVADIEQAVREVYREKEITKDRDSIYEKEGGKHEGVITFGNIKKKMPTLTDFHRVMKEKIKNKELTSTISNFLNGNTLGIFDCQSTLKINDQIICFDISEIKDEIMRYYVCLVLTTWITNKYMATKERNKRYVVVDEAWNLFKNKETSDFLENLARRARKKKVAMILATQNLSEMRQSNQAEAIINCCDTIILLKQSIGSIDEIMKFFKLPSGVKEILTKARPGECILIRGGDVRAIKIDMTKFESEFITT